MKKLHEIMRSGFLFMVPEDAMVTEAVRMMAAHNVGIVIALGRFGMFARGVIFLVVGWFIVQAGLHHDPGQVQGFGGAFLFLLAKPFGHLVLGIVALGFIALGVHSAACARWVRLMGSSASA